MKKLIIIGYFVVLCQCGHHNTSHVEHSNDMAIENFISCLAYVDSAITKNTVLVHVIPNGYLIEEIIVKNTTNKTISQWSIGVDCSDYTFVDSIDIDKNECYYFDWNVFNFPITELFFSSSNIQIKAKCWNNAKLIVCIKMRKIL